MKNYNKRIFSYALEKAGLRKGDIVFSHSNIGFFGYPSEGKDSGTIFNVILSSFLDVLGSDGTIIVPTFTYSYCSSQIYDIQNSPSTSGLFTELFRKDKRSIRSNDPLFSVSAIGKNAEKLTQNVSVECFGKDSFWDRFYKMSGKFCNMNMDCGNTFIHYVEKSLSVPYRYDKIFEGITKNSFDMYNTKAIYFVRDLDKKDTYPDFSKYDISLRKSGKVKRENIGKGSILVFSACDVFENILEGLKTDSGYLVKEV